MIESFGTRLRLAREQRALTVAHIATETKVRRSLIEALERDDVSKWPGGIFRRSFVRTYAELVGLDPDAVVREFVVRFPDPSVEPSPAPTVAEGRSQVQTRIGQPRQQWRSLVDELKVFQGGIRSRWLAAAWDVGAVIATAITVFPIVGTFWMPLAITSMVYFVGGVLLLGASPGMWLRTARGVAQERPDTTPTADVQDTTISEPATHVA